MLDRVKHIAVEDLKLPKDVVLGEILVSFIGRSQVVVENYRGILVYEDQLIRLQGRNCKLEIRGKQLNIMYYNQDEMKITGKLQAMEFTD